EQTPVLEKKRSAKIQGSRLQSASAKRKLTLEQAEKRAAGRPYELINGRMVFKMGDDKHSDVQGRLGGELYVYFKSNPIGIMRPEFIHRLWPDRPHEGRMPDISIILKENLQPGERYATKAPDIAIEIISRDDTWTEIFEKAELYLEKGSKQVWIADPYQKGVMIVTRDDRRWVKNILTCPELLPGFEINVQDLFEWPVASTMEK
ncbi:MAG: Uma2 family endonuclease, partial [bacterium]